MSFSSISFHGKRCVVLIYKFHLLLRWIFGEPQGRRMENCMGTSLEGDGDNGFYDIPCHRRMCSLCNFERIPRLSLRGGCPESHIDTQYVLVFDEIQDGFSKLIGSSVSEIRFDAEKYFTDTKCVHVFYCLITGMQAPDQAGKYMM